MNSTPWSKNVKTWMAILYKKADLMLNAAFAIPENTATYFLV